jgi:prophage regulatory protein
METCYVKILRRKEVIDRVGYSSTRFDALMKEPGFPAPVKLSERTPGWIESEIDEWIANRPRLARAKVIA